MGRFDYVRTRREDVRRIPVKTERLFRRLVKVYTRLNLAVYKLSGGRLMNRGPENKPICIATITG